MQVRRVKVVGEKGVEKKRKKCRYTQLLLCEARDPVFDQAFFYLWR